MRQFLLLALLAGCGHGAEPQEPCSLGDCTGGLVCAPVQLGVPACRAPGKAGDLCWVDFENPYLSTCAAGWACLDTTRRCSQPLELGAACRSVAECRSGRCTEGTCALPGPLGLGDACGDGMDCGLHLICNGGTCFARFPAGTACATAPLFCDDGLACLGGVCAPR